MRQHVNPLSSFFQRPLSLPDVNELFKNDQLPIHLDIGCARGRFLIELALLDPTRNYLGIEIRQPLVQSAQIERKKLNIDNLFFLYCNANVSLDSWICNLKAGQLGRVSIQFPDPWFKRRHFKRRVLQPSLLLSLIKSLNPGAELFIQSDILSVIKYMSCLIESSKCFLSYTKEGVYYLQENPFSIKTEREKLVLNNNQPIYRILYKRNHEEAPKIAFLEKNYLNCN